MQDISEFQFTKEEITHLLNINPNEKNNKRILQYMDNIFKVNDSCICYSEGRGKDIIFIAKFPIEAQAYINLKLWLLNKYNLNTSFNYNLCLKLIYLLMRNKRLFVLKDISNKIDESSSNVKYYRDKMLNDLITRQDLCRQQVYTNKGYLISYDLYESMQSTFKNTFYNLCNSNQKNDYLEIYYLDKGLESDYQAIGVNDSNYEDIVFNLELRGYELVEEGYLYSNGKINSYLKDSLYRLHLNLYGYKHLYIKTVYTLCPRYMSDNSFRQLVTNAYDYFENNLK